VFRSGREWLIIRDTQKRNNINQCFFGFRERCRSNEDGNEQD
jgi:3-methyladenine DNA glycosylase Tag